MRVIGSLVLVLLSVLPAGAQNRRIESFHKATQLAARVYVGHELTFYCGCPYTDKTVDFTRCGYVPQGKPDTAKRLEWEHVVPAENFGRSFPEWRDGHPACVDKQGNAFKGRNCARKVSKVFRFMEADVYNLVPEAAETNRLRSNYDPAMIPEEQRAFGQCDLEIEHRTVEPRPEMRGDMARIYLYMDHAYPGRGMLSRQKRQLFEAWSKQDPVDDWERERAKRIERTQGNANPFVP